MRSYASHAIDFFCWTFGEIVDASAGLRTTITERPDAEGRMRECTAEDGFTASDADRERCVDHDRHDRDRGGRPARRVTVVGSDGVLEMLSDNVHEVGGRILLHTEHGTSEEFRIDPWEEHHYTEMLPWVKLVRDAVRTGTTSRACPPSPTASPARSDGPDHRPALTGTLRACRRTRASPSTRNVRARCPVSEELGFFRELGVANDRRHLPEARDDRLGHRPCSPMPGCACRTSAPRNACIGEALDFGAAVGADSVWFTTGSIGSRHVGRSGRRVLRADRTRGRARERARRHARDRADQPVAHRHQLRVQPPRHVGARPRRRNRRRARAGVLLVRARTGGARARRTSTRWRSSRSPTTRSERSTRRIVR